MKLLFILCFLVSQVIAQNQVSPENSSNVKVLLFTKAVKYIHQSIPEGSSAIMELCRQHNVHVDSTSDAGLISRENLSGYEAIIFYNTSGNILDSLQQTALKQFIQSGHGYAGIHAASATEYDWPWYGKLVGAFFDKHPKIQPATIKVLDHDHPSTSQLPDSWLHEDEWYNFRNPDWSGLNVLMTVDEATYSGGKHPNFHPISWYHEFDGGRSWYTAIGHSAESFKDPHFAQHIIGGILYAAGKQHIQ